MCVNVRTLIDTFRRRGSNAVEEIDSVVSTGAGGGSTSVSRSSRRRIVQRNGRTIVDEHSDAVRRKEEVDGDA